MKARLHRLLWIELLKADAIHSRICHKANVMVLGHGMVERDVPIVLDALDGKGVIRVRLFGLLGNIVEPQQLKLPSPSACTTFPQIGQT